MKPDTVSVPLEAWGEYKRSQIAHLRPYVPGETLSERVSISMADLEAGSPKAGDMIARNPVNHDDQWLVAADYFAANFEPVAAAPKAEPDACPRPLYDWMMERGIWPDDGPAEWPDVIQALNDRENELAQPEAQKGEQEPVGEIAKVIDFAGNPTEVVWTGKMPPIGTKLYAHPAPASDELLEADLMIVADTMKEMQRHIEQLTGARHSMYDGAVGIARSLTKHKGPQS
jgi:hypothetical protein